MNLNRNHFMMAGIVLLLLGVQFRLVDSFMLNQPVSDFINQRVKQVQGNQQTASRALFVPASTGGSGALRSVKPPRWIGWVLISVGSVLCLQSLAMPKPGG